MLVLATVFTLLLSFWHRDALFAFAAPPTSASRDIVDTGYAKYLGNRTFPNTVAYLGIPYAEPPLGPRRFRAPLPLNTTRVRFETKGKVVDATEYPEFCIQGTTGGGDAGGAGSEDCLKVNIYAPAGATRRSKLPVLFYIHGGGYIYGNPRNWPFEHWVNQSPNVVIVSVYYRLSSFGFLSVPELRDSANGDLNPGFIDQIQALRWVKENIASFGGDPSKVTINGESAGGASVELHLVARVGQGERLFRGAIAQSVYRTPLPTPEQQTPLFQYYADKAGCGGGSVAEQLDCLRKAPVSALARAQDSAASPDFTASGYNTFHPVVDGKVIRDFPTRLISEGKFARVPLIVGATTNETLSGGTDVGVALRRFFPSITEEDITELEQAYPIQSFSSGSLRFQTVTGDSQLKCANTILGTAFSQSVGTWVYRYNQRNPTNPSPSVTHAAENWMMFLGTNTGFNGTTTFSDMTPVETAFASELIAYWLSFVRSGDPNSFKLSRSPSLAMVSITISAAAKPPSLAKGLPITLDVSGEATIRDVKTKIAEKFPKFKTARQKLSLKGDKKALDDDAKLATVFSGKLDGAELQVKDLGPQVSWRTVFLVEYGGPLLIHPWIYYFQNAWYGKEFEHSTLQKYVFVFVMLHFLKRELETLFVHRFSHGTMPLFNIFKNSAHYHILSGFMLAFDIYAPKFKEGSHHIVGSYRNNETYLWAFAGLWAFAEVSNLHTHITLRNLRPPGTRVRAIPQGYGFNLVSCPNYFFETLGWAVICAMTNTLSAYIFLGVSAVQMTLWALKKHKNYKKEFGKEYPRRKAIFPFVL
ncbi:hypothetical protein H1R20_g2397, partial [Candolleomyces eurysporus]